jgi:hypothetical protein
MCLANYELSQRRIFTVKREVFEKDLKKNKALSKSVPNLYDKQKEEPSNLKFKRIDLSLS